MSVFQEYPKAMHGPEGAEATVYSAEEEKALGKDWISGHVYWAAIAEEGEEGTDAPKKRGRPKKVVE